MDWLHVLQPFVLWEDNTFLSLECFNQLLRSSKHTTARHMDNCQRLPVFDELISDMLCKSADMPRVTTSKHLDDCLGRAAQTFQEPLGIHTYVHDLVTTSFLALNCHDNKVRNLPGVRIFDQSIVIITIIILRRQQLEHSVRFYLFDCPCFKHSLVIRKCHSFDTFNEGVWVTSPQLTSVSLCELFLCIQHTSTGWTHSYIILFIFCVAISITSLLLLFVILGSIITNYSVMGHAATVCISFKRTPLFSGCALATFVLWWCVLS